MSRVQSGFSMIELIIVVAVMAVLAAVAIPSYQLYIDKSRCSAGVSDLAGLAQFLERQHSNNYSYLDADGDAPALPDPDNEYYSFSIVAGSIDADSFTLEATREGRNSANRHGDITLTQAGVRTSSTGNECW